MEFKKPYNSIFKKNLFRKNLKLSEKQWAALTDLEKGINFFFLSQVTMLKIIVEEFPVLQFVLTGTKFNKFELRY